MFKVHAKPQGGNKEARWEKGLWPGKRFASEEHIISNALGQIARCAAVRPHPELEYDSALFDALIGVPWDPAGRGDKDAPEVPVEEPQDPPRVAVLCAPEAEIPQARKMMITRDMLENEKMGFTQGCRKCTRIQAGDHSRLGLGHSDECREIFEARLAENPELAR